MFNKGVITIIPIILLGFILVFYFSYTRYFPVYGVPCIDQANQSNDSNVTVDLRDYVTADRSELKGSVVMPVAYLKRHYRELPKQQAIHIIAADRVEKNIGARFLNQKGYNVVGYTLSECGCRNK
ncbi:hypothetical protein [Aquibacillus sediminis]|uniref:hypothetical protein n=1 Tax=Aquibacillus sediminis TaxID=2574734 RepID=UPI001109502D|nr:hypothetical protein [Aquibacillus sediminis]